MPPNGAFYVLVVSAVLRKRQAESTKWRSPGGRGVCGGKGGEKGDAHDGVQQ
jgi:hypothetical protein